MRTNREGIVRCQRCGLLRLAREIERRQCAHCAAVDRRYYIERGPR